MRFSAKFSAVVAGWTVVLSTFVACGDEPQTCQCPEVGVPILSKVPYLSRLFRSVGVVHEAGCEAGPCEKTPCADQFERIGVDFEFCQTCPDGVVRFGPIELAVCSEDENCCCRGQECPVACAGCACPSAGKLAVSQAAAACESASCACKCGAGQCCAGACAAVSKTSAAAHHAAACQCAGRDELWEHLVEMAAAKGAAEAALEARQEHSELLDALVEMATKGAALEAKLEAQAELHKTFERMVELASENAQLKARVELAEIKAAMLKETIPVAIEKELLARRAAELEERLATHGEHKATETIRTAKKGNGKKAR